MANKNTFMNWVNRQMIHEATGKDGKTFYNVSFPHTESATGYASVSVSAGQVLAATKKDGEVNPAFASILLGAPEKEREVSICTDKDAKAYTRVKMTNAQIAEAYEGARQAYKAQKSTADAE